MPSPAFCRTFSVNKDEGKIAVISCLFYPISSVIGKVQCLRQKRAKQCRLQGSYKESARLYPSNGQTLL